MRRLSTILLATTVACSATSSAAAPPATQPGHAPNTTTTTSSTTTTTTIPVDCPAAPYELEHLPEAVGAGHVEMASVEPDAWTSVGGSRSTFIPREDGSIAIALIRGALPAVNWPGEKGEVKVDGTRAAVGPHPDGTWVAGWYEEPGARCDLYTMVFYPPWAPSDVESVLDGMNRVGG